jgi:hypothetical protein
MQRPTSVTVFGILNLVFAALGLCGIAFGVFGLAVLANLPEGDMPPNPQVDALQNPGYLAFSYASIGLGALASIVLAIAGIGLLKLKSWGRSLSLGYAAYAIVMNIVGFVVSYIFIIQPAVALAEQGNNPEAQGQMIGAIVGGIAGGCFGFVYPVLLAFFMFRPNVKAAFGAGSADFDTMDIPDDNPDDNPYANPMG